MGAAASTNAAPSLEELQCNLPTEEIEAYVTESNFVKHEIIAMALHYDSISSTNRNDGLIDRSEFQKALGYLVQECLYVDRMFQLIDCDNDGFINFKEFIQIVSILSSKGTKEEKLKFAFRILDTNGDEKLDTEELKTMLLASASENSIIMNEDHSNLLIQRTFEEADTNKDGFIDMDEYRSLVDKKPHMLDHMTINISRLIAEHLGLHPGTSTTAIVNPPSE